MGVVVLSQAVYRGVSAGVNLLYLLSTIPDTAVVELYWQRGVAKFSLGVVFGWALLVLGLILTQREEAGDLLTQIKRMHGFLMPQMDREHLQGLWGFGWAPVYRIPLITSFIMMSITFRCGRHKRTLEA